MKKVMLIALVFSLFLSPNILARDCPSNRFDCARYNLDYIMSSSDSSIPANLFNEAHAIVFLRQYKAGFLVGARGGQGIVLAKDLDTGEWSPPAFVAMAEGSIGFQVGAKVVDAIFFIMNETGLNTLLTSKLNIGGEMSLAVGPVGREIGGKLGHVAGILVYSRARGLFAGAALEGGTLLSDDKANEEFYGVESITIRDIVLRKKVDMPLEAVPLIATLEKYQMLED